MDQAGVSFGRLSDVPKDQIIAHMSDPVTVAHMPLAGMVWTDEVCAAFVATKVACWDRDGLGHWAIFEDGRYIGWGHGCGWRRCAGSGRSKRARA